MEKPLTASAESSTSAAVFPLLLLILIDAIGFAMLTPLLASALAPEDTSKVAQHTILADGSTEDTRHLIYGFATGLYPIMMFFGAPILGQLSDRAGRKSILLVCAGGMVLSYATISAAFASGSVFLLMAGRLLGGITAASQPISLAALVDVCPPERKDFWLSMGLLGSSLGFVIGPALGGFLSDHHIVSWFSIHTPLQATVLLACLNFVLLLWLFHEGPRIPSSKRAPLSLASGLLSLASAFRKPGLREVSLVFLLQELAWGAYFYFVPVYLLHRFDLSSRNASLFMAVIGVGFCLSFAVAMPFLTKRYPTRAIASWSLLATSVLLVASTFAPAMALQWYLALPISVATAVSFGTLVILFTDLATEDTKGEIMGIVAAINAFSFGIISFLGGGMQALRLDVPLIVSFLLMTASWIVFNTQKPQTTTLQIEHSL
jgi:DHA1 family tetracycline resistance protein-like MFS transporter